MLATPCPGQRSLQAGFPDGQGEQAFCQVDPGAGRALLGRLCLGQTPGLLWWLRVGRLLNATALSAPEPNSSFLSPWS